jgi:hypothetical protein
VGRPEFLKPLHSFIYSFYGSTRGETDNKAREAEINFCHEKFQSQQQWSLTILDRIIHSFMTVYFFSSIRFFSSCGRNWEWGKSSLGGFHKQPKTNLMIPLDFFRSACVVRCRTKRMCFVSRTRWVSSVLMEQHVVIVNATVLFYLQKQSGSRREARSRRQGWRPCC